MIRLLAFLGFCVLTALIASWLSAQQGVTVINWLGWRVEIDDKLAGHRSSYKLWSSHPDC